MTWLISLKNAPIYNQGVLRYPATIVYSHCTVLLSLLHLEDLEEYPLIVEDQSIYKTGQNKTGSFESEVESGPLIRWY